MTDWTQFQVKVNAEDMEKLDKLEQTADGDYENVPYGQYEVSVRKLELGTSKKGDPMVKLWFKVINNPEVKGIIFYNRVVFGKYATMNLNIVNRLLKTMKTDVDLTAKNFVTDGAIDYGKYAELLEAVYDDIKAKGYEYALDYNVNEKGFDTYNITEVFESVVE